MNAHENDASGPHEAAGPSGPTESLGQATGPSESMGTAPDPDPGPRPVPNPPPVDPPVTPGSTPTPPPGAGSGSGSKAPLFIGGGIAIIVLLAIILGFTMK